jgi:hypothetical protein
MGFYNRDGVCLLRGASWLDNSCFTDVQRPRTFVWLDLSQLTAVLHFLLVAPDAQSINLPI